MKRFAILTAVILAGLVADQAAAHGRCRTCCRRPAVVQNIPFAPTPNATVWTWRPGLFGRGVWRARPAWIATPGQQPPPHHSTP